jgi:signal transduction histidine kinase
LFKITASSAHLHKDLSTILGSRYCEAQQLIRAVITRQVDHLTHLVDDVLDVARISEGKLPLRDQAVDLDGVLKAALETAAPALEAHQETIEVATPNQPCG